MEEGLNERFESVCESIEMVYYKLTHLNMQYHHFVRHLEKTKAEIKTLQKELTTCCCSLEKIGNEEHSHIQLLTEASIRLYVGIQTIANILPKLRRYTATVDRLMDANDEVEECLNLLDDLRIQDNQLLLT